MQTAGKQTTFSWLLVVVVAMWQSACDQQPPISNCLSNAEHTT